MGSGKSSLQKVHPKEESLSEVIAAAQLGKAAGAALKWCEDARLTHVSAVLAAESELSEELVLKVLERKRLLLALGGDTTNAQFEQTNNVVPTEPDSGATLQLTIRSVTGSVLMVEINTSNSVLNLKTRVQKLDPSLEDKHFVLVLSGAELVNKQLLSEYALQENSELQVCISEDAVDVDGLLPCLDKVGLGQYHTELRAWCAEAGAISLDEVRDSAEYAVASVGFAEADRRKLWSSLGVEEARANQLRLAEEAKAEQLRLEEEERKKKQEDEIMRGRMSHYGPLIVALVIFVPVMIVIVIVELG